MKGASPDDAPRRWAPRLALPLAVVAAGLSPIRGDAQPPVQGSGDPTAQGAAGGGDEAAGDAGESPRNPFESGSEGGTARRSADTGVPLTTYLETMAAQRLLAAETGSVERMRELVRLGEEQFLSGRHNEAALTLVEVAESPRFADFMDLDEFRGAEYMLARALERLGALRTASRYLERILARGSEDPYFGPAYRRYVDVALASGELASAVARAEELGTDDLPTDAENELHYLRGRERYDAGDLAAAEQRLGEVSRHSRFFASAQYLRGAIAAHAGQLEEAEAHFCSVATTGDDDRYTFFVDDRYFEVKDLARLGLGRVAHEGGRADDAFYYYFQVPNDSERVAEAMFEAAYAMYEGGDLETAVDLLDQLETKFPESPFVDEAAVLRGYVHLGRCEFEIADRLFRRFAQKFSPIVGEVRRILANPSRQQGLYEELLVAERRDEARRLERQARRDAHEDQDEDDAEAQPVGLRSLLLALMRVDPAFYRLHANIRTLDAEAARGGRLQTDLAAIAGRVQSRDRPIAAVSEASNDYGEESELRRRVSDARSILRHLTEQLDAMRRAEASSEQLAPLEQELSQLAERIEGIEGRADEAMAELAADSNDDTAGGDLPSLLRRDMRHVRRLPARVATVRSHLVAAANEAAMHALRDLLSRLGGELRRARIGRIDAVMGSKRRIEIQIESLAAGRFPPELLDPLQMQGLLRDDEEYWPFEGELWTDEFEETVPLAELAEDE